jgi:hypothetical protein
MAITRLASKAPSKNVELIDPSGCTQNKSMRSGVRATTATAPDCALPGSVMCEAHTVGRKKKIALSELGSEEDRLRRQRAYDVARTLESLHLEGSNIDPETIAIAQRYVDGEITIDELAAAIEARATDVS